MLHYLHTKSNGYFHGLTNKQKQLIIKQLYLAKRHAFNLNHNRHGPKILSRVHCQNDATKSLCKHDNGRGFLKIYPKTNCQLLMEIKDGGAMSGNTLTSFEGLYAIFNHNTSLIGPKCLNGHVFITNIDICKYINIFRKNS